MIRRANDTHYGLDVSVWLNGTAETESISKQLKAGTVWVNTHGKLGPNVAFGCHKSTHYGVECGVEGLESYYYQVPVFTRPGKESRTRLGKKIVFLEVYCIFKCT